MINKFYMHKPRIGFKAIRKTNINHKQKEYFDIAFIMSTCGIDRERSSELNHSRYSQSAEAIASFIYYERGEALEKF